MGLITRLNRDKGLVGRSTDVVERPVLFGALELKYGAKKPLSAIWDVLEILEHLYPEAHCALNFENPWQLLVATILSAQCTDRQVNIVTRELFARFKDAQSLAAAQPEKIEEIIRSTGFFRNKAKNIIGCAAAVVERHGGKVPQTLEELVDLPGVGRKTANVVLGNAFNIPGLAVDTHVKRLVRRLGWSQERSGTD